jgi:uncharacterized protein YprB with RNaseH-like and TPR domain
MSAIPPHPFPSHVDMSLWLTTTINNITTKLIAGIESNMIKDSNIFCNDRKIKHKNLPQPVNLAHLQLYCTNLSKQFEQELNSQIDNLSHDNGTKLSLKLKGKTTTPLYSTPRPLPRNLLQIASHKLIYDQLKNIQNNLLFIDIETDGLPPKCNILSICMTTINLNINPETSPNYNEDFYLIKPCDKYKIDYQSEAYKINKISQTELDNKSTTLTNIADHLIQQLTQHVIVGYNINSFDIPIIRKSLGKIHKALPPITTIDLYRAYQQLTKHDLSSALKDLGCYPIPTHLRHQATADTEACIRLMAALTKTMQLPTTLNDYKEINDNNINKIYRTNV